MTDGARGSVRDGARARLSARRRERGARAWWAGGARRERGAAEWASGPGGRERGGRAEPGLAGLAAPSAFLFFFEFL